MKYYISSLSLLLSLAPRSPLLVHPEQKLLLSDLARPKIYFVYFGVVRRGGKIQKNKIMKRTRTTTDASQNDYCTGKWQGGEDNFSLLKLKVHLIKIIFHFLDVINFIKQPRQVLVHKGRKLNWLP